MVLYLINVFRLKLCFLESPSLYGFGLNVGHKRNMHGICKNFQKWSNTSSTLEGTRFCYRLLPWFLICWLSCLARDSSWVQSNSSSHFVSVSLSPGAEEGTALDVDLQLHLLVSYTIEVGGSGRQTRLSICAHWFWSAFMSCSVFLFSPTLRLPFLSYCPSADFWQFRICQQMQW